MDTHTHTHTYIYIYIYIYECVSVIYQWEQSSGSFIVITLKRQCIFKNYSTQLIFGKTIEHPLNVRFATMIWRK